MTSERDGKDRETGARILVRVEAIAAGGDGLGREPDGRVVFVPRTAPGELVEAEITETHRTWARAKRTAVLDPGPTRRDPPCPYYERCGGCQIQHLEYEAQLRAKSEIIADALARLGGFAGLESPPIFGDPDREFGYRNRIGLTLRRVDRSVYAGYHAFDAPGHIVDVEGCPLAEDAINQVWQQLRGVWGRAAERLPAGDELRLTLRTSRTGQVGLIIEGEGVAGAIEPGSTDRRTRGPIGPGPDRPPGEPDLEMPERGDPEGVLAEVDGLAAIWRLGPEGRTLWHVGADALEDQWGPHELRLAGQAFVQVNREIAEALERYVRELCGAVNGRRVIDAYCGFGLRGLELARGGARVVGIDTEPRAVESAEAVARREGLDASFLCAPVERALEEELPVDLVILNPPRRGVEESVAAALAQERPERVIYVSCDPATLARDLQRLGPGFELIDLCGFDMFPQTAHVETVATLRRRS